MRKTATEAIVNFQTAPISSGKKNKNLASAPTTKLTWPSVVVGRLEGFNNGNPTVNFPSNPLIEPISAQACVLLSSAEIGREVILVFSDGDPKKPIILNLLVDHQAQLDQPPAIDIKTDGEKLLVTAKREIELRCGDASITLTAAGKVLLKGTYLLSRSSGYNKIKGAAVDIN